MKRHTVKCDDCRHGAMDFPNMGIRCARGHTVYFDMPDQSRQDWGWRPVARRCRDYRRLELEATRTDAGTTYGIKHSAAKRT